MDLFLKKNTLFSFTLIINSMRDIKNYIGNNGKKKL